MTITKMMQLPATKSRLQNVLLCIITHPRAAGELVATAAELIAANARLNYWIALVGKRSCSSDELERILEQSDVTDDVDAAWRKYEESSGADSTELLTVMKKAVAVLRACIRTEPTEPGK